MSSLGRVALTVAAVGAATVVAAVILLFLFVRGEAKWTQDQTKGDFDHLIPAMERFEEDCGRYPSLSEGLDALTKRPPELASSWRGPYLERTLDIDPWGQPYLYEPDAEGGCTVTSYGADRLPGGEGQDADLVLRR